jgi:hypothetical protein
MVASVTRVQRLLVLGACLGAASCRGAAEEPAGVEQSVYAIEVAGVEGPGAGSRSRAGEWVRREVEDALRRAVMFAPAQDRPELTALEAVVAYDEIRTRDGDVLRMQIQVERPPALVTKIDELEATVELEREDGEVELQRDVPVALDRAVAVLEAKVRLAGGGAEASARLLVSEDPELVLLALGWSAANGQRENADVVAALLDHADERVRLGAVECLGRIGTSDHVPQLVATARLADRAHAGRLYEALAELGGEHAAGFLEFAARNEDDPALAEVALRSLERLQAAAELAAMAEGESLARGHR